ncbi:hypothetical protein [Actinomadura parmotrematis]|uniref:DUF35 domain-containing protein n=1 Tax=Actinomadura parmotrematis TaxID=2864039 RepID=A0ABS7FU24_9ACTN|nr:hypothetical protein [Actinomadura parmotrematis]MBW8483234.1 hypothetical protein [Actinomadura parmotrematis]
MIDRSGEWWRGEDFADLAEFVTDYAAEGYPVARVAEAVCACGRRVFEVEVEDGAGARRRCTACGTWSFIADSGDHWGEQEPYACGCPCGAEEFAVAVGFALRDDGEIRWISVGLRCVADGILGVHADWKIDYGPTGHLFALA